MKIIKPFVIQEGSEWSFHAKLHDTRHHFKDYSCEQAAKKPMNMIKSLVIQQGSKYSFHAKLHENHQHVKDHSCKPAAKKQWTWSNLWWFKGLGNQVFMPHCMQNIAISKTSHAKQEQESMKMIRSLVIQRVKLIEIIKIIYTFWNQNWSKFEVSKGIKT